jgi:hypothetical protein
MEAGVVSFAFDRQGPALLGTDCLLCHDGKSGAR